MAEPIRILLLVLGICFVVSFLCFLGYCRYLVWKPSFKDWWKHGTAPGEENIRKK